MNTEAKTAGKCTLCAEKTPAVCLSANIFMFFLKMTIGVISGSLAVVSDALHTGADVLVAFVTMFTMQHSLKPPDKGHPYGHGKIEFISGLFVGIVLLTGASYITVSAVGHLLSYVPVPPPRFIALLAAVTSIAVNELLFRYVRCAAKRVNSSGLEALAWDNRSDAISSIPVFFGILGAIMGFPLLDPLAALFVGIVIGRIGWKVVSKNLGGLMDAPMDSGQIEIIRKLVLGIAGVSEIGYLKTRAMGRKNIIDLEIHVGSSALTTG